jgi:hypothetical protein
MSSLGHLPEPMPPKSWKKSKYQYFVKRVFFFSFPVAFVAAEIYYHRQHAA